MKCIAEEIRLKQPDTNCAKYLEEVDNMVEDEMSLLKAQNEALKKNVLHLDKTLWEVHTNFVNLQNTVFSQSLDIEKLRKENFKIRKSMRALGRRSVNFEQRFQENLEGAGRRIDFLMQEYVDIRVELRKSGVYIGRSSPAKRVSYQRYPTGLRALHKGVDNEIFRALYLSCNKDQVVLVNVSLPRRLSFFILLQR